MSNETSHAVEMGVPEGRPIDLLPKIRRPVLVTHGALDAIVRPIVVDRHKAAMPHAQIHVMEKCGHAPFWQNAGEFNRRLRVFAEGL